MTFDELCARFHVTQKERAALVWHLAMIRARKLVEELAPQPKPSAAEKE